MNTISLKDQIGRVISLSRKPTRIISLVPSQTELLYDLGLGNEVVGITKFCIHPNIWHKTKQKVGGTKNLNFKIIDSLNPDLIIINKEENSKEEIEALQEKYTVYISDIFSLVDAYKMMADVGQLTGMENNANHLIEEIKSSLESLQNIKNQTVGYVIWQNPIMLAGTKTFINQMLKLAGFQNILSNTNSRYPEISKEELSSLKPDYVFLSSEPFPFKDKHQLTFEKLLPNTKVVLVDGEMFSWYGSRLKYFLEYIQKTFA